MANIREQAQFDTSGVRGFDRGGIDWARQSLTYTLKIYDTSDVKVAEIAGDLENTTLTKLDFKTNRKGGCADFSFELANKLSGVNTDALLPHQTSGQVLSLNGSGYASIADAPEQGLNMGLSDFMIEARVRMVTTGFQVIVGKRDISPSVGWMLFQDADNKLRVSIRSVGVPGDAIADASVNDGRWHSIFLVVDRDNVSGLKLFIDGSECSYTRQDDPSAILSVDATVPFQVGGRDGANNLFTGLIDEVRVWNFGYGGLPADYEAYISWRYTHPFDDISEYDSGSWNGYADADRSELTTNGTMEADSTWAPRGTPTTEEQSTDQANNGSNSWKIVSDATGEGAYQDITTVVGEYYEVHGYIYVTAGDAKLGKEDTDGSDQVLTGQATAAAWNEFNVIFLATETTSRIFFQSDTTAVSTFYVDDITVKRTGEVADYELNGDYTDETNNSNDLTAGGTGNVFPEYYLPVIEYNYKTEIYLFNHFSPWFTGYIEEVPEAGTDKRQYYAGYGYFEKFNKKLVNTNFTAQEISVIATTVLDDDIIANYSAITKNTDKIESTGYTLAGTLQFERQFARDVFNLLADVANDYEFGVDADAVFFFRAISSIILERFWVGTHITEFTPEKVHSKIVNRWYIYAPPFSDGSNYQIMVENGTSQSSYGLAEDFVDAPAIISIYSSTNIASGKSVTTNPAVSTPANITDGDNSILWESGTDQIIGHWIKIDLGSTYDSVAKVVLDSIYSTAQEYHATLFKIETSTNDSDYTEVFSASSDPGWKPTITFQPVAAKYIKITLTAAVAKHWKVGQVKVHELDTADLERWAAQVLTDSKDPILRAVATIKGIDKVLLEKQIVAPINPRGKCRITDRDGTTTHDYAIISCEYSLSSSGLDLTMELGHAKREVSDWIRTLRSQIAQNRLLNVRTSSNIASGTGFNQGSIVSTMIAENAIETPHLRARLITADKYEELRNTYVMGDQDSLDASKFFEMDFEIVSEMTSIVSVLLSFRIRQFRAYATGVPNGGGATSGATGSASGGGATSGATGSASGGGATSGSRTHNHSGSTSGASGTHTHDIVIYDDGFGTATLHFDTGTHRITQGDFVGQDAATSTNASGDHTHPLNISSDGSHDHTTPNHTHPNHQHSTPNHTHPNHQHSTPDHIHSLTFGIFEDSTSPNLHYHIDNGAGYGGASASYNSDQLDLVITGSISGTGFKRIKFDSDARCRISAWVLCKIDLTA